MKRVSLVRWLSVGAVVSTAAGWLWLRPVQSLPAQPGPLSRTAAAKSDPEVPARDLSSGDSPVPDSVRGDSSPRPTSQQRRAAEQIRAALSRLRAEAAKQKASGQPAALQPDDRAAASPSAAAPTLPAPVGSGNQAHLALGKYVRERITQDFFPMGTSCYQELLTKQGSAKGRLILEVTLVGDRSVGGVVDSVEVNPESTIRDQELILCMRESMMGMPFDAPPDGNDKVTFTLPIDLSPDPPPSPSASR